MGTNAIQDILTELAHGRDLPREVAERAFQIIMNGGATPAQTAAFLMGLRQKGETVEEITAGATVLRHHAHTFAAPANAIDTCGTGGDGLRTFNVSTAVAIVVAACGVPVVKHGNRGVTSVSGSSDILTALGVEVQISPEHSQAALASMNLCFLYAPLYHHAMRHVGQIRLELGLRTVFNLLGPLANPAGAKRQLLGVYDAKWLEPLAEVLHQLGCEKAWVVHGRDGMDEITTTDVTDIVELNHGNIRRFTLSPEEVGLVRAEVYDLKGGLPEDNARALQELLSGKAGAYRDIVLLNTAAALVVADACEDVRSGIELASSAIDSGRARATLAAFIHATQGTHS
jgi:anthranilate phosphoribosyltransferase